MEPELTHADRLKIARRRAEAYRASKDLRAVQELLGHSTPTVTALYTRIDGEAGRAAVRALPMVGS